MFASWKVAFPLNQTPGSAANIRKTVDSLYKAFSFKAGYQPQWAIIKTLSLPGATFVAAPAPGVKRTGVNVEQFIADYKAYIISSPIKKTGYQENIISATITRTENVANVTVVFKAIVPHEASKRKPGMDNIQLLLDHGSWKIVAFTTQAESELEK